MRAGTQDDISKILVNATNTTCHTFKTNGHYLFYSNYIYIHWFNLAAAINAAYVNVSVMFRNFTNSCQEATFIYTNDSLTTTDCPNTKAAVEMCEITNTQPEDGEICYFKCPCLNYMCPIQLVVHGYDFISLPLNITICDIKYNYWIHKLYKEAKPAVYLFICLELSQTMPIFHFDFVQNNRK